MSLPRITKRWPGKHCGKLKVWTPSADAMSYSSIEVETWLPPEAAKMIYILAIHGTRLGPSVLRRIELLALEIAQVVKNQKEAEE